MVKQCPHLDFNSVFPAKNSASLLPTSLQQISPVNPFCLNFNLPNSKLDDSPAELPSTFACEESGEDAPRSEGSPGLSLGSASTLEEAPNSKHGQQGRRKSGGTRGGRERGINKSAHTVYKGVRKRKGDRWVSEIREPGKKIRIWLGTFSSPEMAASAYDVAAFNLKTPLAYLNFPEYVSSLPISQSRSPKHIQEAAGAAAAAAALRGVPNSSHMGRTGGLVATPNPHVDEISTSLSMEKQSISTRMEMKASSWIDEDMIFNMPDVLAYMAEGLMIPPPLHYLAMATNSESNTAWNRNAESSLWNM